MDIWFALENKLFNELVNFEFQDIRKAFGYFEYYVPFGKEEEFVAEATKAKQKYEAGIKKINKYEVNEYEEMLKKGINPTFEQEPGYQQQIVEAEARNDLIELFKKYFDVEIFLNNKSRIKADIENIKENEEDISNLRRATTVIRHNLYMFLSIVGWYQRHKHYFLSRSDVARICRAYTTETNIINAKLNLEYSQYRNVFGSWGRVDPKVYLDIDKISLRDLVLKFCKTNTAQLAHIAEICADVLKMKMKPIFNEDGDFVGMEDKMDIVIKRANQYIEKCEKQGIMKVLE